ncbi:hypothetical protein D5F01_LYC10903 [Larimichthys crocea]|uniref:Uncharacterized protein n=2 Tax=Larimichthys crocea TaxID=215358 RepID=A0A6G0IIG3_LARCR|nr:hypothetical protein D5F01_LYC10903 [Larimichthys crocea]
MDPGFSDSEVAVLTPDAADLLDRLDLSMSSIDMTNTSLTMHEEKDGDVSGVEELEDSVLSSSADNETDPQELSSQAAMDLTSALASLDALSGIPPAEPSHLLTKSPDLSVSISELSNSPSPPMDASSLPVEYPDPPAEPSVSTEDPPCPSPVDLLQSSAVNELIPDDSFAQAVEDPTGPVEESTEPLDAAPAHHCSHESDEELPEELSLE